MPARTPKCAKDKRLYQIDFNISGQNHRWLRWAFSEDQAFRLGMRELERSTGYISHYLKTLLHEHPGSWSVADVTSTYRKYQTGAEERRNARCEKPVTQ